MRQYFTIHTEFPYQYFKYCNLNVFLLKYTLFVLRYYINASHLQNINGMFLQHEAIQNQRTCFQNMEIYVYMFLYLCIFVVSSWQILRFVFKYDKASLFAKCENILYNLASDLEQSQLHDINHNIGKM